jgi:sulfite reductase beta subunit-like hemoprotein
MGGVSMMGGVRATTAAGTGCIASCGTSDAASLGALGAKTALPPLSWLTGAAGSSPGRLKSERELGREKATAGATLLDEPVDPYEVELKCE